MHLSAEEQEGPVSSVLLFWRDDKLGTTTNAGMPANVITREKLDRRDFRPEDLIDVKDMQAPLILGKPANYMLFVQQGQMRSIIANLRPFKNPDWTEWPQEERKWLQDSFGALNLIFQYSHVPAKLSSLNAHDIPFSLGVRAPQMSAVLDAVGRAKEMGQSPWRRRG
ncbi:MAG: hypothetical protein LC620_08350 [Halobacteriales archaeon]|nr:hypothetical protein [Halobacteriales archaeon]